VSVETEQLVGDDWAPSSVEDPGAAELGARIEAAEPVLVPRAALEGRCGLEDRELWQLGVRTAHAGARSRGGGVLLRLAVVGAVAAAGLCLAMIVAGAAELATDESSLGAPATIGMLVFFACIDYGLLRLAWGAAGRERARRIARRRVAVEPVAPLLDPNARLTVAVLDGPGVLRVLLLWLRGHPRDADVLEARVVAERRVPRDEPARAEDAVVALSEVAMLVTRVRTDARDVEGPAVAKTYGPLPAVSAASARSLVAASPRATPSRMRVGPDWQPDGTTAEGEAELARRLLLAKPRRWSAELLAPLVVDDPRDAGGPLPKTPRVSERRRRTPRSAWITTPGLALIAFLFYFVVSDPSADLGTEIAMRALFLGLTGWTAWKVFEPEIREWPNAWRRRALMRRVDDAACDAAVSLEGGLPGGPGAVVVTVASGGEQPIVSLMHLRRLIDAPPATLEARVLAERRLAPEDDLRETVGRFLLVADDQAFTSRRGHERAERLRRFSRRLGVSAAGRGRGRLQREPVALLAVVAILLAVLMVVLGAVAAVTGGEDADDLILFAALVGAVAVGLLVCARRWTAIELR
jgi:hypothetical protein